MFRRVFLVLIAVLLLCVTVPLGPRTTFAKGVPEVSTAACGNAGTSVKVGDTQVQACPATVQSGQTIRFVVHSRHFAAVHVELQYPDNSVASATGVADKQGAIVLTIPVRYNPIDRYAQAQFTVTSVKGNHTDVVPGTVTIAQATPLSNTRLQARPSNSQGSTWCPGNSAACVVHNNSQILIRVDTDAGAQVTITLFYPDGQSVPCPTNTITSNSFASNAGTYLCELPVYFPAKAIKHNATMTVTAQVRAGNFVKTLPLRLYLVSD